MTTFLNNHFLQFTQSVRTLQLQVNGKSLIFEINTSSEKNFCCKESWKRLGKPELQPATNPYYSATKSRLPVLGTCTVTTDIGGSTSAREKVKLNVVDIPGLNLLRSHA